MQFTRLILLFCKKDIDLVFRPLCRDNRKIHRTRLYRQYIYNGLGSRELDKQSVPFDRLTEDILKRNKQVEIKILKFLGKFMI